MKLNILKISQMNSAQMELSWKFLMTYYALRLENSSIK